MIVEELDYRQQTVAGGDVQPLLQEYEQTLYGVSAYGEIEWSFTDDFERIPARYRASATREELRDLESYPRLTIVPEGATTTAPLSGFECHRSRRRFFRRARPGGCGASDC